MKLKYSQIYFMAHNHKKRRVRKKYLNILKKIEEKKIYEAYKIKIYLSGWFHTITFYGTEEEMTRFVDSEAMAYCVRGIEVTHKGVTCYTKANLSYNFDTDSDEDSDVGYVDLYEIFPQFKKKETNHGNERKDVMPRR